MTPFICYMARRADIRHEAVEFLAQAHAFGRKGSRRIQHVPRCGPGFRGAAIDLHDIGGRFKGSLGDILNAARDFLSRRALLLPPRFVYRQDRER
jgi:hypothetical protein